LNFLTQIAINKFKDAIAMRIKTIFTKTVAIQGLIYLFACGSAEPTAALPDPSAAHCIKLGGGLKPLLAIDGSESLMCVLVDREVDTWVLFRETHKNEDGCLVECNKK
jgi:putative hemolysin